MYWIDALQRIVKIIWVNAGFERKEKETQIKI